MPRREFERGRAAAAHGRARQSHSVQRRRVVGLRSADASSRRRVPAAPARPWIVGVDADAARRRRRGRVRAARDAPRGRCGAACSGRRESARRRGAACSNRREAARRCDAATRQGGAANTRRRRAAVGSRGPAAGSSRGPAATPPRPRRPRAGRPKLREGNRDPDERHARTHRCGIVAVRGAPRHAAPGDGRRSASWQDQAAAGSQGNATIFVRLRLRVGDRVPAAAPKNRLPSRGPRRKSAPKVQRDADRPLAPGRSASRPRRRRDAGPDAGTCT